MLFVYLTISAIILVNLLIAMFADTFQRSASRKLGLDPMHVVQPLPSLPRLIARRYLCALVLLG